jgi:DNA primase
MVVPEQDDKIPPAQRAQMQAQHGADGSHDAACDFYRAQLRGAPMPLPT